MQANELMARQSQAATAAPLGDLFEYRIKEPVTLRKNLRRDIAAVTTRRDTARQELNTLIGNLTYEG